MERPREEADGRRNQRQRLGDGGRRDVVPRPLDQLKRSGRPSGSLAGPVVAASRNPRGNGSARCCGKWISGKRVEVSGPRSLSRSRCVAVNAPQKGFPDRVVAGVAQSTYTVDTNKLSQHLPLTSAQFRFSPYFSRPWPWNPLEEHQCRRQSRATSNETEPASTHRPHVGLRPSKSHRQFLDAYQLLGVWWLVAHFTEVRRSLPLPLALLRSRKRGCYQKDKPKPFPGVL